MANKKPLFEVSALIGDERKVVGLAEETGEGSHILHLLDAFKDEALVDVEISETPVDDKPAKAAKA